MLQLPCEFFFQVLLGYRSGHRTIKIENSGQINKITQSRKYWCLSCRK